MVLRKDITPEDLRLDPDEADSDDQQDDDEED